MAASDKVFYVGRKKYNCMKGGKPYYRKTVTIGGKRYDFYGDGEKDCLNKITEAQQEAAVGLDLSKRDTKVSEAFDYWLYNVKRLDDIKASTFTRYESIYRLHIKPYPLYNQPVRKLDSSTLQNYFTQLYEEQELTGSLIHNTAKVWKMFCEWAVGEGYIAKNPCKTVTLPGQRQLQKKAELEVFSPEEMDILSRYMTSSKYVFTVIVRLAFATGMRQGEILSLKWQDISEDRISIRRSTAVVTHIDKEGNRDTYREVWDTKTQNAVREIPILEETYNMLAEHRLNQKLFFEEQNASLPDYMFTSPSGELLDATNLNRSFKRLQERAGLTPRKFHAMRHTFATQALARGVDVKHLQLLMGHADITTTYGYVAVGIKDKADAIQKMGRMI